MLRVPERLLEAARRFAEALPRGGDAVLYYHYDPDGIVSGAVMKWFLEKRGVRVEAHGVSRGGIRIEPGKVYVLVDLPQEYVPKDADAEIYVLDHHKPREERRNLRAVLNPYNVEGVEEEPYRWNAALLAWIVAGMPKEWEWKVAAAHWSDRAVGKHTEDWMNELYERYGKNAHGDPYIVSVAKLLGLGKHFPKELPPEFLLDLVTRAKDPREIDEHPTLTKLAELMRRELERLMKEVKENPTYSDERLTLHIFESPVHGIKSTLATAVSVEDRERIYVICQRGDVLDCSLRCQEATRKGWDLGKAAKEIAKKLGGSGGGHPPAAGLVVPAEREENLKKLVIEILGAGGS